jgi:chromate reductase, NAD(P)H dehydrogenase (quinone)
VKILTISGSLRARSTNMELLRAAQLVAKPSWTFDHYDRLGSLPHFNPDLDFEGAVPPESVRDLRDRIGAADALLICSPEYAHGVPGSLKNALDWMVSDASMIGKPIALLNASARSTFAHPQLAETLRTMSTRLVDDASLVIPLDGRRLDAAGIAADPALASLLEGALDALVRVALSVSPEP